MSTDINMDILWGNLKVGYGLKSENIVTFNVLSNGKISMGMKSFDHNCIFMPLLFNHHDE